MIVRAIGYALTPAPQRGLDLADCAARCADAVDNRRQDRGGTMNSPLIKVVLERATGKR
jgi:hypothetical protein